MVGLFSFRFFSAEGSFFVFDWMVRGFMCFICGLSLFFGLFLGCFMNLFSFFPMGVDLFWPALFQPIAPIQHQIFSKISIRAFKRSTRNHPPGLKHLKTQLQTISFSHSTLDYKQNQQKFRALTSLISQSPLSKPQKKNSQLSSPQLERCFVLAIRRFGNLG